MKRDDQLEYSAFMVACCVSAAVVVILAAVIMKGMGI